MCITPHPLTKTTSTQPTRYRRKVFAILDLMGPKLSQTEHVTLLLSMFYCMCRWNSFFRNWNTRSCQLKIWNRQLFILISLFNQFYDQNLLHNKFYFMPLHVSSTCDHQEVKIALHCLWYRHNYRWPSRAQVERGISQLSHPPDDEHMCSKHVEA